jgi:hypothetical protein
MVVIISIGNMKCSHSETVSQTKQAVQHHKQTIGTQECQLVRFLFQDVNDLARCNHDGNCLIACIVIS